MNKYFNRVLIFFLASIVFISFHLIFNHFFPNQYGLIGHDYAMFFPYLLDGYLWYRENGLFSAHWFTPSFCGGIVMFGNPQEIYSSIPQLLTIFIEPLYAVYLTFLIFALTGFSGFYFLLRQSFELSSFASLLGATLFLFNGFYIYHLIIGHLTFHGVMLTPLIALMLIKNKENKLLSSPFFFFCSITALLISYLIYSGISSQLSYVLFSILILGTFHSIKDGEIIRFLAGFFLSVFIAILISLYKIVAILSYLKHFPRDEYLLPGFESVYALINTLISLMFLGESNVEQSIFVNNSVNFNQHEWEFGITFIPLLLLVLFLLKKTIKLDFSGINYKLIKKYKIILLLVFLLLIPLSLNYYNSEWNVLLKKIPIIKSNITLHRWFFVYIPFIIIVSSMLFDKTFIKNTLRLITSFVLIVSIIVINYYTDKSYYHAQSYEPDTINKTYKYIKNGQYDIEIKRIATHSFSPIQENKTIGLNDLLVSNTSQLYCYEPIFGYSLEWFPKKDLYAGSVMDINNKSFNLKNPACYIFPDENDCLPGDHYKSTFIDDVDRFRQYKSVKFNTSLRQKFSYYISIFTLFLIFVNIIFFQIRKNIGNKVHRT